MTFDPDYNTEILDVESQGGISIKVEEGGGCDLGLGNDNQIMTARFSWVSTTEDSDMYLVKWLGYSIAIMQGLDPQLTAKECQEITKDVISNEFDKEKCQYEINGNVYSFYNNEFLELPTFDAARLN